MDNLVLPSEMDALLREREETGGTVKISPGRTVVGYVFDNEALENCTFRRVEFSGCEFKKTRFSGSDLSEATFANCSLPNAFLDSCNLVQSSFTESNLNDTCFNSSDMSYTTISMASCIGSDFSGVDLSGARIQWAVFGNTVTFSLFEGAKCLNLGARYCNFRGVDARLADFSGASFEQCNLSNSDLSRSRFDATSLSGVDLSSVTANKAHFRFTDLSGANLQRGSFVGASFESCDMSRADLHHCLFSGAAFDDVNMEGTCVERSVGWSTIDDSGITLSADTQKELDKIRFSEES